MRQTSILKDEKGVALIVAMVMLLVVTLIGMSSIFTTVYETRIAGNERLGSAAFYAAVGGAEAGVSHLPNTDAYSYALGNDQVYRSGKLTDSGPQSLAYKGTFLNRGDDVTMWEYKRYQVNVTGESLGAKKEVELQVKVGPYVAGTQYNN